MSQEQQGIERITLYSYAKVWRREHKLYGIDKMIFPAPINPMEILYFIVVVLVVFMVSQIFPAIKSAPPILTYALLPYGVMKLIVKKKLDGKNPIKFFKDWIVYLQEKSDYLEKFQPNRIIREEVIKLDWSCSRGG